MSDREGVEKAIQIYLDSAQESSADLVRQAFHPNAKITGYIRDGFAELSVEDYANVVAANQPSPKEKGETLFSEVLSIEIAGKTAVARVRDDFQGNRFLDTLSFVEIDGQWSIYNKLYHVEGPAD